MAIVSEVGAARMTLDAVAERAGVSKGGLLYNFPSKDALLQGMIQRFCQEVAEREERVAEELPDRPGRALLAFLQARLEWQPIDRSSGQGLLAAVAANPRMLDPVREDHRKALEKIAASGSDPDLGRVLWLATEGLAFLELLGVSPFSDGERRDVADVILRMAAEDRAGRGGGTDQPGRETPGRQAPSHGKGAADQAPTQRS